MEWELKVAALGVVLALIGAVPLVSAIQHKDAEIALAKIESASLDPVRTAVLLQRHLQAHRGLASMVLGGNSSADPDRRARQADVSAQFPLLKRQLGERGIPKAIEEAQLMKAAWDQLSQQVDARSISADESFAAHTALVEQNIGVIDMVAQANGQTLGRARSERAMLLAVLGGLGLLALGSAAVVLRAWQRRPRTLPAASIDSSLGELGEPGNLKPEAAAAQLIDRVANKPGTAATKSKRETA